MHYHVIYDITQITYPNWQAFVILAVCCIYPLAVLPFKGRSFTRPLAILHRKGRVLTPAMKKFVETLGLDLPEARDA